MSDDFGTNGLFTPGASDDAAPAGDVARQAIASLGGYTYQVAAAALAWVDLVDGARLYLEVAEDYATAAERALQAVQVKDTEGSGSATLNNESVREAIDAFVDLVARNPGRDVSLRYLTTSPLGTEHKTEDRPAGQAGLLYWRKAAAGANIGPLRAILASEKFSPRVRAFVQSRDDAALRRDLLQKIHWDCGTPDLAGVMRELQERLVILGRDRFRLPAHEAQRLADVLVHHVLKKSILKNAEQRVLTRAELYVAIDMATRLSMPRAQVEAMAQFASDLAGAFGGATGGATAFTADGIGWLISGDELPPSRATISRRALEEEVGKALKTYGAVVLFGGSGLGKSLTARAVARAHNPSFSLVDLRDLDPDETRRRLDFIFGRFGALPSSVFIFEDLNHLEDDGVALSFGRVTAALHRRDRVAIVTCYRRPTVRALTQIGIDAGSVLAVPYFSQEETNEVVGASGGEASTWGPIAHAAGGQGHPQLVHAFVMGMAARGWPASELKAVVMRGFVSDDIDSAREAARRNIAAELPKDAKTLLYRLSLVIGRFDRPLALNVGTLSPAISQAGESLDALVGPWIEAVGRNVFRVSPLAAQSGHESLTGDEQRAVHGHIALQMLSRRKISVSDANMVFGHALAGKSEPALVAMTHNVMTSSQETLALLGEHFFVLRLLRTDQPIYSDNSTLAAMIRLAQFRLTAAAGTGSEILGVASALLRETNAQVDARFRERFESLALSSILITLGIADHIPQWMALLRRFRTLVESDSELLQLKANMERGPQDLGIGFYGALFSVGSTGISSVERLEAVMRDLDELEPDEIRMWLRGYEGRDVDFGLFVNGPWSEEHKRDAIKADDAASRYERMAEIARPWGLRALTLQLHVARVVMLDEYVKDKAAALAALDAAQAELGDDVVLDRARAKIHWHADDHAAAFAIWRRIADRVGRDSFVERAFAMREAAINAAKTGDWAQAEKWFLYGQTGAAASDLPDMRAMAVGLGADAAVAALVSGSIERALTGLAEAVMALPSLDPDSSLRAAYCHRVVRHTVLWAQAQIEKRETKIDGEPIEMLPGTCSNPEPPAAVRSLPLGPIDLAWYMLAEAEIASGVDVGLHASLRQRLAKGPVPVLEVSIRNALITKDVETVDTAKFAEHLSGYIDGMAFLQARGKTLRATWNVLDPERGELPKFQGGGATKAQAEALAADAILAFCSIAWLIGKPDAIEALEQGLKAKLGSGYLGEDVFKRRRGEADALGELDRVVLDLIKAVRAHAHIDPRDRWGIALRLFEKARHSNFKKSLIPRIAEWFRSVMRRIISEESFRLSRPMQIVPELEAVLANGANDEGFVASLLLAAADAVSAPLALAYREQLEKLTLGKPD